VLVTWGSKLGGSAGIARIVADVLEEKGFDVDALPASEVGDVRVYHAAVIGGAIYANRWHREARRFVSRNLNTLRRMPVWMFSSGPLDASADGDALAPIPQVDVLMERVGAQGHVTFGGRLAAYSGELPAKALARVRSGDWRNPERVRAWAERVAVALPNASARPAQEPPGRSPARLVTHGLVGWALCAMLVMWLLDVATPQRAVIVRAIAATIIFGMAAWHYFSVRGAREPLPAAVFFTLLVVALDLTLPSFAPRSTAVITGFAGTWLPWSLVFVTTYLTGLLRSTLPWSRPMRISEAGAP
jgi:menaquinone-dependent protoporphyrinogen oxidase